MESDRKPEKTDGEDKNYVERLYDKLPFTFKQVDVFVKVLVGFFLLFMIYVLIWGR